MPQWLITNRIPLFLWALLCLSHFALAEPNYRLFIPTDLKHTDGERFDLLRLEMENVQPESVSELVKAVGSKGQKTIVVYVSAERDSVEIIEGLQKLSRQFPKERLDIRLFGTADEARVKKIVSEFERETPYAKVLRRRSVDPKESDQWIEKISRIKVALGVGERSVQLFLSGVEPSLAGAGAAVALVATDTALNYFSTKYESEIGTAFSEHSLIGATGPKYERLQEFYTGNYWAKFAKGTGASILVWSLASNLVYQTLGHYVNPSQVELATWADATRWVQAGLAGSIAYSWGFNGMKRLKQEGWIDQPQIDKYLRRNGILFQLSSVANTSGNPLLLGLYPFLLVSNVAAYALPGALGSMLWPRNDRVVLVDSLIENRATLNGLEAIDSTKKVEANVAAISHALSEVKSQQALQRNHTRGGGKFLHQFASACRLKKRVIH